MADSLDCGFTLQLLAFNYIPEGERSDRQETLIVDLTKTTATV